LLTSLVVALLLPRFDYCNAVIADLPENHSDRLQSVLKAAARLIFSVRRYYHIAPLLKQLQWLPVHEQAVHTCALLPQRHNTGLLGL
jgi:hypothetical protein